MFSMHKFPPKIFLIRNPISYLKNVGKKVFLRNLFLRFGLYLSDFCRQRLQTLRKNFQTKQSNTWSSVSNSTQVLPFIPYPLFLIPQYCSFHTIQVRVVLVIVVIVLVIVLVIVIPSKSKANSQSYSSLKFDKRKIFF